MSSLIGFIKFILYTLIASAIVLVVMYRFVPPASTVMLISGVRGEGMKRHWVPIERISPNLVHAVLAAEDARFCEHQGIDWKAAEAAYKKNERKGRVTHGASTITMQVAKNLFLWNGRWWIRKALEVPLALLIDFTWPKKRVMEVYLNIAEWGPGIFGADAGARRAFGRSATSLTVQQASLMAAALPNPKERNAGKPDGYQQGLAATIRARMNADGTVTHCVR